MSRRSFGSPKARRWFATNSAPAISAVSIWEIRLKWRARYPSGKSKLNTSPDAAIRLAEFINIRMQPLTLEHAAARLDTPLVHKDPFDEMLMIQAQVGHAAVQA